MLDYRNGLSGSRNRISSFNPAYQIVQTNSDGTGDIEFDFWGAREATCYYDTLISGGSEIEFQVQRSDEETGFDDCPLPNLWGANNSTDASRLLPDHHFYSSNDLRSPSSRKKAIEEGRKQMMEMISNMPESSYELSLKDMVEILVKEKAVSEDEKSILFETDDQSQIKKKKIKACPITRSGSMDADNFLIKMFSPSATLSFKKKSSGENSSKVSPSPSSEGSEKKKKPPVDKQWWIKRIFMGRDHKNREDCNSNGSRDANRNSFPGCWVFFFPRKARPRIRGTISSFE